MIKLLPYLFFQNPLDLPFDREIDLENHGKPGFATDGYYVSPDQARKNYQQWGFQGDLQRWIPVLFNPNVVHSHTEIAAMTTQAKVKATPPPRPGWVQALPKIGDSVLRADIDFYNLPFSQNVVRNPQASSGLLRSSEYNPKEKNVPGVYVEIPRQVFGRAHGEIRPIQGQDESLITRVTLDYQGAEVKFLLRNSDVKMLRKSQLELDCFTAVTAPTMDYNFDLGPKSVTHIGRDGNNKYENGCLNRKPEEDIRTTDFYSETKAPPKTQRGKNPDWMFYFQPIESTLGQTIMRRFTNKHIGALWLWANNPTFGFVDKEHYEKLGIRYNTWPRRFGDLIRFFSPLFDADQRTQLRRQAPFLNPNSEYLDENGDRQKIPRDPKEVVRLNAERAKLNVERKKKGLDPLPEIPRSRGPAVDWVFTDLMNDPKRMALTPKGSWPSASIRLQFKPGTQLDLPVGKITIHPETEVKVSFRTAPLTETVDGKSETRAQAMLTFSIGPLNLGKTDLDLGPYHLEAGKNLYANRLEIQIPFIQVYTDKSKNQWKLSPNLGGVSLKVQGLRGQDLKFEDNLRGVQYQVEEVNLRELTLENEKDLATAVLTGLRAKKLEVLHEVGSIAIEEAEIPEIKLQARHDLKEMSVKVPKIASKGEITLKPNHGVKTEIQMKGSSEISSLYFGRKVKDGKVTTDLRFRLEGAIPEATVRNPLLGEAGFSMREGEKLHRLRGGFQAYWTAPLDPAKGEGNLDYQMHFNLPYTGFHLQSPLVDMPKGLSTLRDGTIRISREKLSFEGDLNLGAREIRAPGTDVFRWKNFTVNPHMEDVSVVGSALFEYSKNGFRLRKREGGEFPIQAKFRLTDSSVTHFPDFSEAELRANPELGVIKTDVKIEDAQVVIENLQEVDYKTSWVDGIRQGRNTRLKSGPIYIHHIKGSGNIWVDTFLWSWLRGSFPHFGVPLSSLPAAQQKPRPKKYPKPDAEKLIGHLSPEKKKMLWDEAMKDYSNFVYIGGISIGDDPDHAGDTDRSLSQFRDLIVYTHETGNHWQFGAVGIPEISFLQKLNNRGKPDFKIFTGSGPIYNHIFLKDPKRGHNPFILRTPGNYRPPE